MAEQKVDYSQYYKPLDVGKNTLWWWDFKDNKNSAIVSNTFYDEYIKHIGNNRYYSGLTKEQAQDPEFLAKLIKTSGILTEEALSSMGDNAQGFRDALENPSNMNKNKLWAVIGAFATGRTGNYNGAISVATKKLTDRLNMLNPAKEYVSQLDELVSTLERKGAGKNNIIDILNAKSFSNAEAVKTFTNNLNDKAKGPPDGDATSFATWLSGQSAENSTFNDIFLALGDNDSLSQGGIGDPTPEGGDPEGGDSDPVNFLNKKSNLAINAPEPEEQIQSVLDTETLGNNTDETGLADDPEVEDSDFFIDEESGRKVVKTDKGLFYEDDNSPYISPNQNTIATEIQDDKDSANAAEDVVDEAVQQSAEGMGGASDINIAYTGGAVNEGVANALGWTRNELDDGTVQFTDPRTNSVYTLGADGALTDTSGKEAYTEGMLNFQENDFAGAFQDTVNDYLFGSSINRDNFADYGFTYDEATGEYTGPNGQAYTVDESGTLQDVDGNALRNQGFLGYQQDLEAAGEQYTTDMTSLRGEYSKAFSDYEKDLQPRMGQLDSNISALNQVAADAGDRSYYNQLRDVYFADSMDQISRDTESSRDAINQMYANSGMDASSPAYTAAMVDLQNKRSEAARSARRQSIIDSYTMGSNMLGNRQNALNSAQAGITTGINALGSLYDVRVKGLDVDKDMISTIYSGKQNQAAVGISGLNTIAQQQQSGINAERDQFNTNLNLRTGLNAGTIDSASATASTAGQADANATDDYWKGMGWMQTLLDNNFNWQATGAALKTQFPDFDFQKELDPKFYQQLFPNG